MRGPTVDEIVGAARAMRGAMTAVRAPQGAIDLCGTGGDGHDTFNISTAASLVVAGCGVAVAKHGNRSASSRTGTADVLEALGVKIDIAPKTAELCLREAGFAFLFAPTLSQRHAQCGAGAPRTRLPHDLQFPRAPRQSRGGEAAIDGGLRRRLGRTFGPCAERAGHGKSLGRAWQRRAR